MAATYTINRVPWKTIPSIDQVVTIEHKKGIDSTWTEDSTTVAVKINSDLVIPFDITGLDNSTVYNFRVTNNCDGTPFVITLTTPPA